MIRLAAVLVLMAGSAAAQDLPYSDAATETCLADASDFGAQTACIGASSGLCMDTPAGGSTVGMGGCLDRELSFWDAMLNANYKTQMARAKASDEETRQYNPNAASQATALRDMQRAWITYRDAACDYERSQWGGGTGGGPATYACLMELTGLQALRLQPDAR
jgi:uncharacterized protein YecT (DUF1311 family)